MDSISENRMKETCVTNVPDCFISDHEGFTGTIKNYTKDFVVTEIDINRQLVNMCVVVPQKTDKTSHDALLEKSTRNTQGKRDSTIMSSEYIDPSGPVNLDLNILLGHSLYEELERFLVTTPNVSDPKRDEVKKQTRPLTPELSLGSFPDKHQRMTVHRAVRHHFPSLMTVTHQFEIKVRENPDYRELSGLVTGEESNDFFRFIDAKVPGSSYSFRPDDIKDHRTAVHHFLSRRFGKLVETKSFNDQGGTAISVRLKSRKRTKDDCVEEEVYTGLSHQSSNTRVPTCPCYLIKTIQKRKRYALN